MRIAPLLATIGRLPTGPIRTKIMQPKRVLHHCSLLSYYLGISLTQDQELPEHELSVVLMSIQKKLFDAQLKWEPWKAMAVAAGAGAALMGAMIGIITFIVSQVVKH
jgi:hypothetical protein